MIEYKKAVLPQGDHAMPLRDEKHDAIKFRYSRPILHRHHTCGFSATARLSCWSLSQTTV